MRVAALLVCLLAACGGGTSVPDLLAAPHVAGELLVILERPDEVDEVNDLKEKFEAIEITRLGQSSIFNLTFPAGTDLERLLKELDDDLRVVVSEPNYVAESPEGGPADVATLGSDLLASIPVQPQLDMLHLAEAHVFATGAGVLVAVVDTGVDFDHPFLAGAVDAGGYDFISGDSDPDEERNFVDDDGDGVVDEQFGHGTFVASLVLAVAPGARILPVRVLDDEGFGTAETVAAGIVWAVDAGVQVINVSVDIPRSSEIVKSAIEYAKTQDVVVVASAGNDGRNALDFPARFEEALGVAALDALGVRAFFSNFEDKVAVSAPGVDLIGAMPVERNPPGTARWSGTSFAAPLVAGAAALVREAFPAMGRDAVRQRLRSTAMPVDALNPGLNGKLGAGLIQPAAAVR